MHYDARNILGLLEHHIYLNRRLYIKIALRCPSLLKVGLEFIISLFPDCMPYQERRETSLPYYFRIWNQSFLFREFELDLPIRFSSLETITLLAPLAEQRKWKPKKLSESCQRSDKILWNMKLTDVPIIIGVLRTISKRRVEWSEEQKIQLGNETTTRTTLLKSCRILEYCRDLLSFYLEWNSQDNESVKTLKKPKIKFKT